jgi:hypothetical protein
LISCVVLCRRLAVRSGKRFAPSTEPLVASEAKAAAGVEGWLLAETYFRARPLPGFVLGLPATQSHG